LSAIDYLLHPNTREAQAWLPTQTGLGFAQGALTSLPAAATQIAARAGGLVGRGVDLARSMVGANNADYGGHWQSDITDPIDQYITQQHEGVRKARGLAPGDTDWQEVAGQVLSPWNMLVPGGDLTKAALFGTLNPTYRQGGQPTSDADFWLQKGEGAGLGAVTGLAGRGITSAIGNKAAAVLDRAPTAADLDKAANAVPNTVQGTQLGWRASKAQAVEDVIKKAGKDTGKLQSGFEQLATDPRFSPQEQQAITGVATGSPTQRALQWAGQFSPFSKGSGGPFSGGTWKDIAAEAALQAVFHHVPGLYDFAIPAAGITAQAGSKALTRSAANAARDLVARGGVPSTMQPFMQGLNTAGTAAGVYGGLGAARGLGSMFTPGPVPPWMVQQPQQ
jgi:hypothetical protein